MEYINSINFKATPLNKVKIKKYNTEKKKYVSSPATFILLDGKNKSDLEAIKYISKTWKDAVYIKNISTSASWMENNRYIKVFAITEQKENFNKPNPEKILGLAEMREEQIEGNVLAHIQDKPSAINVNANNGKYKRVGRSMIKSLQKIYDQIALESVDNKNIEKFHRDNGFIEYANTRGNFVWYKNIFLRLKMRLQNFRYKSGIL